MASNHESDLPSSPTYDESDAVNEEPAESDVEDQESDQEDEQHCVTNKLANLEGLQLSRTFIKPKEEYYCFTCKENYSAWLDFESHLITHVSLPSVVIDKLPSDDEETHASEDENWSDDDDEVAPPPKSTPITPKKVDISQLLKKTGLSLKNTPVTEPSKSSDAALSKLSGLGFTIKKNVTPIKKEAEPEKESNDNAMRKLSNLGGIKLKLKSSGTNSNCFKVINGLKDFKASDDEDEEESGKEETKEACEVKNKQEDSEAENESGDENVTKNVNTLKNKQDSRLRHALEGVNEIKKEQPPKGKLMLTIAPLQAPTNTPQSKPAGRTIKQTPKRNSIQIDPADIKNIPLPQKPNPALTPDRRPSSATPNSTPERRQPSVDSTSSENIVVKQEPHPNDDTTNSTPLFSQKIKSERETPPLNSVVDSGPIMAKVKEDPDAPTVSEGPPIFSNTPVSANVSAPLLPVTKKEPDTNITIIEINGDSNDEDDDCCVVSTTPAADVKPILPKIEKTTASYVHSYSNSQPTYTSSTSYGSHLASHLTSTPSMEKQHSFSWNPTDTKPSINAFEKSADEMFESLLSNSAKKESLSSSEASEYISLDTLGPQHSCEVCNTRFTDISLLEDHRRMTGHTMSLVPSATSTLLPYAPSSNILSSLLPVKHLADQVGKLSGIGGSGFTHQQNVMINIQAYPGASGVMGPPQPYNTYPPGQNMPTPGFSQTTNNLYGAPGQTIPDQYSAHNYMGQQAGYGQYPPPQMPKSNYPGVSPQNPYTSEASPYPTPSPLQSMQQAVYGQSGSNSQMNQMGPGSMGPPPVSGTMGPPLSMSNHYIPSSSPSGTIRTTTSSGVKIQNVQTFPPGQMPIPNQSGALGTDGHNQATAPGQMVGGQMPAPGPIRLATGANMTGMRPRMPAMRGQRPTIRPGIHVHGQVRGVKPGVRMPLKRPGGMPSGPGLKKRPNMLISDKHDNEDCQVMALQKQRDGMPMIQSVQGAKDKLNIGSQISITKKTVNKEANAMANVLASRGISVKQKQKSRSPSPERPVPHIPNLGAGVSIKHTSKASSFSIPEAKVGSGMLACKICKKMFGNQNSLYVHMSSAHPSSKLSIFKCDECPASYPKSLQLQHHKRVFHNVNGPNKELGLPVVDLSQESNLKRLSNLGIYSFIPLANREQADGCFGIPVISVHNMQNGLTSGLQALGAEGLLSLGPLKPLPNS